MSKSGKWTASIEEEWGIYEKLGAALDRAASKESCVEVWDQCFACMSVCRLV